MVLYTPHLHHRRSIRLKGYDYSQPGLYFITICCQDRACLFGNVMDGEMKLNDAGKITDEYWMEIPKHFPNTVLHEHIVMPNHIHGIIELTNVRAENIPPRQIESTSSEWAEPVGAKNFSPLQSPQQSPPEWAKNISPQPIESTSPIWAKNISPKQTPQQTENISSRPVSPSKTIGSVVRGFKIGVTKWMRQHTDIYHVWQRNYYEHIIRNEKSYLRIAEYIINNPATWKEDKLFLQ